MTRAHEPRPARNPDLHGNVPENSAVALLLIDVINDMDFEGSEPLVRQAPAMAERIASLKRRAKSAQIPVIYINGNFGRWQSDFRRLIDHCLNEPVFSPRNGPLPCQSVCISG